MRHGLGLDSVGFNFPDDLDEDDDPIEGVQVYDSFDEVELETAAFHGMMVAALRLWEAYHLSTGEVDSDWWAGFQADLAALG